VIAHSREPGRAGAVGAGRDRRRYEALHPHG
jgi:hypothetical protein